MNHRLTVHVQNAKKIRIETGKKIKDAKGTFVNETREKIYNTLSFHCKTEKECMEQLLRLKSTHTIAIGRNNKKKQKYNKELYNISFAK